MLHVISTSPQEKEVVSADLPRWDLSRLYPGLDSPDFKRGFAALIEAINDLEGEFDRLGVG
jgi:hypothetical protein